MREAAASALEMATGRTRAELDQNVMLRMALTRCLEIVGEAAAKVTPATRSRLPLIPFGEIVSMRNRLIHAYFDVDLDIVWTTVSDDLQPTISALDAALAGYEQ
jgi:uncharacterized protein with HEPN domain